MYTRVVGWAGPAVPCSLCRGGILPRYRGKNQSNPRTSGQVDDPVRRSGTCQHGRAASRPRCGLTPAPAEQTTFKAILLLHLCTCIE